MTLYNKGMSIKICGDCGEALTLDQFHTSNGYLRSMCKKCDNIRTKENRRKNPTRAKDTMRRNSYKKFGITIEQYNELLMAQDGRCAICHGPSTREHFDVDHDHVTGIVRGLLCSSCNIGLGYFKDNPMLLKDAATYLER